MALFAVYFCHAHFCLALFKMPNVPEHTEPQRGTRRLWQVAQETTQLVAAEDHWLSQLGGGPGP